VLAITSADRRSLVTVHLYLHAAKESTSYLGLMQVPFVDASGPLANREVSATVPRGSQPVGSTLSGRVTPKAGSYNLRVVLDATQRSSGTSQRIEEQASVVVK
jgi:hypothetical protein